jgi:hypothetical protein
MASIRESLSPRIARRAASLLACTAIAAAGVATSVAASGCGDEDDASLAPIVTQTSSQEELEREAREAKRKARELKRALERELPANP